MLQLAAEDTTGNPKEEIAKEVEAQLDPIKRELLLKPEVTVLIIERTAILRKIVSCKEVERKYQAKESKWRTPLNLLSILIPIITVRSHEKLNLKNVSAIKLTNQVWVIKALTLVNANHLTLKRILDLPLLK